MIPTHAIPTSSTARCAQSLLTANSLLASGSGNGYRLADLGPASNPSGWSGVIKVKTPAGATLGHILLYATP